MKDSLWVCPVVGAAFGTFAHFYRFITEFWHLKRASELGILTSSSLSLVHLLFVVSFALVFAGVLSQRRSARIILTVGTLGVFLGYGSWFSYSSRALRRYMDPVFAQYPELIPPQTFGLLSGYWWDLIILIVTIVPAVILILFPAIGSSKRSAL